MPRVHALVDDALHRCSGTYLDDDQMAILTNQQVVSCTRLAELFDNLQEVLTVDFWGMPMELNISHKSCLLYTSPSPRDRG